MGATKSLASTAHELGGEGIGHELSDTTSATLSARIGDTFTISFSEILAGNTVAPFLGAGLNNVGWVVDTSLVAKFADVVLDYVKTTDSRQAIVGYDINNPNVTQHPIAIRIFRSDKPTYDSSDSNNIAVGGLYQVSVPGSTLGHHDTIPINLFVPGMPKQPLSPDPSRPYVLAVVVDAQGNPPTDLTVDEARAHFKIWVIADVTYGFQLPLSPPPDLAVQYDPPADAGRLRFGSRIHMERFHAFARRDGGGGNLLYQQILGQADALNSQLGTNDVIDVQLIGHSRGSAVIGQAMQDLVNKLAPEEPALEQGYYKLTFLDPHPANLQTVKDVSINPDLFPASRLGCFSAIRVVQFWVLRSAGRSGRPGQPGRGLLRAELQPQYSVDMPFLHHGQPEELGLQPSGRSDRRLHFKIP